MLLLASVALASPSNDPLPLESFVHAADAIVVLRPITRPATYDDTFDVEVLDVLKGKVPDRPTLLCFPRPPLVDPQPPPVQARWKRTLVYLFEPAKHRPGVWIPMIFDELEGKETLQYRGHPRRPVQEYLDAIRALARLHEMPDTPRLWSDGLASSNPLLVAQLLKRFRFRPSPWGAACCACGPGDAFGKLVARQVSADRDRLVGAVLRRTRDPDAAIAAEALRAADALRVGSRALRRALEDERPEVATTALRRLAWADDDAALPAILDWLKRGRHPEACLDALYGLTARDRSAAIPLLRPLLDQPRLRARARTVLTQIEHAKPKPAARR